MTKRMSTAQAKAHFSALVAEVAFGGEAVLIERRGRPMAALVSAEAVEQIEAGPARAARPAGALALVGVWAEVDDTAIDALLRDIYEARMADTGRPVALEG